MAIDRELQSLRDREADVERSLRSSPTAFGSATPTTQDLSEEARFRRIKQEAQQVLDKKIQEKWYGPKKKDDDLEVSGKKPLGLVGGTLETLQAPFRAGVGAFEHLIGQGQGSSLLDSVVKNIKEGKHTSSDILRKWGVSGKIAAPLGFALDITFDPVNWMTAGTTALIPRAAKGLITGASRGGIKAGLKGLVKGTESSLLRKASFARSAARIIPGSKRLSETAVGKKILPTASSLNERALKAAEDYNNIIGREATFFLDKDTLFTTPYRQGIRKLVDTARERSPRFARAYEAFNYDNAGWMRLARIQDALMDATGVEDEFNSMVGAWLRGEKIEPYVKRAAQRSFGSMKPAPLIDFSTASLADDEALDRVFASIKNMQRGDDVLSGFENMVGEMDDVATLLEKPAMGRTADFFENGKRIVEERLGTTLTMDDITNLYKKGHVNLKDLKEIEENGIFTLKDAQRFLSEGKITQEQFSSLGNKGSIAVDDLKRIVSEGFLDDTGVKWYDDMRRKVFQFKVSIGKDSKKTYEVGRRTLEVYGDLMSLFKSSKVGASVTAWTNAVVGNPTMAYMAGINVTDPKWMMRMKQSTQIAYKFKGSELFLKEILDNAELAQVMSSDPGVFRRVTGLVPKNAQNRVARFTKNMETIARDGGLAKNIGEETSVKLLSSVFDDMSEIVQKDPSLLTEADFGTSFVQNELLRSRVLDVIQEKAADPNANPIYKILNVAYVKSSGFYEGIDQSFKLGTSMYASMDGLTERELRLISRGLDITDADLTPMKVGGEMRWKLSGAKALELSNEIFMNYNAMPAAIRVLRSMPLLGSPFASFAYLMTLKSGKTLLNNPAAFNKMQFAIKEFGGEPSPFERKAIAGKYYQHLAEPGMFRTNFFTENPYYINMGNMLPYYTMSMFDRSDRRYEEFLPNKLTSFIDRSPFVKDPVGSVIFDNFIAPLILRESQPLSQFGQPVVPYNAGVGERSVYAARDLSSALVPGVAGFAGLASSIGLPSTTARVPFTETQLLDLAPSYRWRQLGYATKGKTPIGKKAKESPLSRTLRSLAGIVGVPIQSPVDLTYIENEVKKSIK